jgi:acetate kinase
MVTPQVLAEIEQAVTLAPLHQPIALEILHLALRIFADVPHFACFDTAFHQTMPPASYTYPLPAEIRAHGIRRYGFHGISFESIVQQFHARRVPLVAGSAAMPQRMVIAHLGSGVSITALRNGQSVDTTMGLTPCGGMLMGTRPGDLDPGLVFYLLRQQQGSAADAVNAVERLLNKASGLLALSGASNDMRLLRAAADRADAQAALAIQIFVERAQKTIGGFFALLGGLDALVFTAGIGEHDARTRAGICRGLESMGVLLHAERNAATAPKARCISAENSRVAVYVLPAEEDRTIAAHVAASLSGRAETQAPALPQAQSTC